MLLAILGCVLLVGAPEAYASEVKRGFDRVVPVPPPGETPGCNGDCCPPEAPDCLCGSCGVRPFPRAIVSCVDPENVVPCCDNPDEPCNTIGDDDGDDDSDNDGLDGCNDECCPPEAPDCACGSCINLPPGQIVQCSADSGGETCCDDPDNECNIAFL